MLVFTILFSFILFTIQFGEKFLTPIYFPNCYANSYYEFKFNNNQLLFNNFKFQGLPKGLKGFYNGTINGVTNNQGSFPIKISYCEGETSKQKQMIFHVQKNFQLWSSINNLFNIKNSSLMLKYPDRFNYRAGSDIYFKLYALSANKPFIWRYFDLPSNLFGDQNGLIFGKIFQEGYHQFRVQCSDSMGFMIIQYFTFKVQLNTNFFSINLLKNSINSKKIQIKKQNKNKISQDDFKKILTYKKQADLQFQQIIGQFVQKQDIYLMKKNNFYNEIQNVKLTNKQLISSEQKINCIKEEYNIIKSQQIFMQDSLRLKNNQLIINTNKLKSLEKQIIILNGSLTNKQQFYNKSLKLLTNFKKNLKFAQNNISQLEQRVKNQTIKKLKLKIQLQNINLQIESLKLKLKVDQQKKQIIDVNIILKKQILNRAKQVDKNAEYQYIKAQSYLQKSQEIFSNNTIKLNYIRNNFLKTQNQFSKLQWEYELALNKLYIAQARKQTADRGTAIAVTQAFQPGDSNQQYLIKAFIKQNSKFIGCDLISYPSISGTVIVTQKNNNSYKISSGHQIFYGPCTQSQSCSVGDLIFYNGYIVNGIINAILIKCQTYHK